MFLLRNKKNHLSIICNTPFLSGTLTSIPSFCDHLNETLNRDPVSVQPRCWWDIKPEFIHSLENKYLSGSRITIELQIKGRIEDT